MLLTVLSRRVNMYMKKTKLLCILHRSPPFHGAAKVGDFIGYSKKINAEFDCRFITIKSSKTIEDIGKVSLKKYYFAVEVYVKVFWMLLIFRPDKLYYTPCVSGIAFYRDLMISTLWKIYSIFISLDVYYHYHTKGVGKFVTFSSFNLKLTNLFVKDVNIILLSPLLENDINNLSTYKSILLLPNGVEDGMKSEDFENYINRKYKYKYKTVQVLYLAHMMRDKGYLEALELANLSKCKDFHFHFAGSWKDEKNKKEFFEYIKLHKLEKNITYHGFLYGVQKSNIFKHANILLYPSKNDAFPLTVLEALSYGVPVLSTDEGSIPFILDKKSGVVLNDIHKLQDGLSEILEKHTNVESAKYCRQRYLDNFSLEQFEENLVKVLK